LIVIKKIENILIFLRANCFIFERKMFYFALLLERVVENVSRETQGGD